MKTMIKKTLRQGKGHTRQRDHCYRGPRNIVCLLVSLVLNEKVCCLQCAQCAYYH